MPRKTATDPRITKRKVTLTSVTSLGVDADGKVITATQQITDYWDAARPGLIEALTDAAKAAGWQSVQVGTEPDAGPGGYDGQTVIPAEIPTPAGQPNIPVRHELAGQTFEATQEG